MISFLALHDLYAVDDYNHYAGFGPRTVNAFRKILDISEVTWNECVESVIDGNAFSNKTKQTTLSNF